LVAGENPAAIRPIPRYCCGMTKTNWTKDSLLNRPVVHVDPTAFDSRAIIDGYRDTAFQARNTARAADLVNEMVAERECAVILTLAGSLVSAGMKRAILTLLECNMVDAIVSSGANIVDQDFFEGLGYQHFIAPGSPDHPPVADETLRELAIDRIYDTYIDEDHLRICDDTMATIIGSLEARPHSSREIIDAMGAYLASHHPKAESIVLECHRRGVPIFVPAFSDCSAGFGLVLDAAGTDEPRATVDSGKDFFELTRIKLANPQTGLFMLGGGVPKNFVQDIVVSAELLVEKGLAGKYGFEGDDVPMHAYAVQLTVADARDGALSGSTLREACSWGKVGTAKEQMVYGEVTTLLPLIVSDAYHRGHWKARKGRRLADLFAGTPARA
jgi:deoxyhypusine synthase